MEGSQELSNGPLEADDSGEDNTVDDFSRTGKKEYLMECHFGLVSGQYDTSMIDH